MKEDGVEFFNIKIAYTCIYIYILTPEISNTKIVVSLELSFIGVTPSQLFLIIFNKYIYIKNKNVNYMNI